MEQDQERAIILRILEGKRDAYALLVDEYKRAIFNLAYRMTGSHEDARDLAQETFIRAYINLKKFRTDKRFFSWLYTIALNIIKNHLKQKKHFKATAEKSSAEAQPGTAENPETGLLQDEMTLKLQSALQALTLEQRALIILRFYDRLSFDEIAEISRLSASAVKMRVYRALERLRVFMEKE